MLWELFNQVRPLYLVVWMLSWSALGVLIGDGVDAAERLWWLVLVDIVLLSLSVVTIGSAHIPVLRQYVLRLEADLQDLAPSLRFVGWLHFLCAVGGILILFASEGG